MTQIKIEIKKSRALIENLLQWADSFPYFCYFNPQATEGYPYGGFPHQIAVGSRKLIFDQKDHFRSLQNHLKNHPDQPLYGYFSYDLKNEIENLTSENECPIAWDSMGFFQPDCILHFDDHHLVIEAKDPSFYVKKIKSVIDQLQIKNGDEKHTKFTRSISPHTSKQEYIRLVNELKNHILEGDIYEINYCINFSSEVSHFNPLKEFMDLSESSPTPFATLLKSESKYVLCASPERFIKYEEGKMISQPIKGTAKRSENFLEDKLSKERLQHSEKERAENMMIVDLVRNDLAKSAKAGTVKVEELFGIYSFKQVHHMISTITALPKDGVSSVEIIKSAFPMGSMTGAPKIRAMQLIEQFENTKRNIFSGSIGYFSANGHFDFNVVIRSIFYNKQTGKLHYQVGSAITYDSQAEEEYAECLLKAKAIEQLLLN